MNFAFNPPAEAPFLLTVAGNNESTVQLNGIQVFGPGDLPIFSQYVDLLQNNMLQVQLANSFATLSITILGYRYKFAGDYSGIPISPFPGSDDVDWRSKGAVTPVMNQGTCQASWAFSATAALEGAGFVEGGTLVSLSTQELLDCAGVFLPCTGGGSPAAGIKYAIAHGGLVQQAQYPYTGVPGRCLAASAGTAVVPITGVLRAQPGDENALRLLVEQGPVSVVLNGNWLSSYASIPPDGPGSEGNGANPCTGTEPPVYVGATLVGFQSSGWILKMSLGDTWGDRGYVYLASGKNVCGIADYAVLLR
jgi:hypothetical protein